MLRSGVGLLGAGAMVTEPADEVVSLGSLSRGGVEGVPLAKSGTPFGVGAAGLGYSAGWRRPPERACQKRF
jgi:hypothetical protein